jgi:hypothetical protein
MKSPWSNDMKEEGIVGRYFVTIGTDRLINNQGLIKEMISDAGYYIVTTFSWITGDATGDHIVSFDDIIKHFIFTGSASQEHCDFCDLKSESVFIKPAYTVGEGAGK